MGSFEPVTDLAGKLFQPTVFGGRCAHGPFRSAAECPATMPRNFRVNARRQAAHSHEPAVSSAGRISSSPQYGQKNGGACRAGSVIRGHPKSSEIIRRSSEIM